MGSRRLLASSKSKTRETANTQKHAENEIAFPYSKAHSYYNALHILRQPHQHTLLLPRISRRRTTILSLPLLRHPRLLARNNVEIRLTMAIHSVLIEEIDVYRKGVGEDVTHEWDDHGEVGVVGCYYCAHHWWYDSCGGLVL